VLYYARCAVIIIKYKNLMKTMYEYLSRLSKERYYFLSCLLLRILVAFIQMVLSPVDLVVVSIIPRCQTGRMITATKLLPRSISFPNLPHLQMSCRRSLRFLPNDVRSLAALINLSNPPDPPPLHNSRKLHLSPDPIHRRLIIVRRCMHHFHRAVRFDRERLWHILVERLARAICRVNAS